MIRIASVLLFLFPTMLLSESPAEGPESKLDVKEIMQVEHHWSCASIWNASRRAVLRFEPGRERGTMELDGEIFEAYVAPGPEMITFVAFQNTGAANYSVKLKSRNFHFSQTGEDARIDFGSCTSLVPSG